MLIKFTLGKLLVPLEKENFQPNGLPYPILSRCFFRNYKFDVSFQQERPRAQQWHSNESVQEVVQMEVASGTLDKSIQMCFLTDSVHHPAVEESPPLDLLFRLAIQNPKKKQSGESERN